MEKSNLAPPKQIIAISKNGFNVYSRYGMKLDKHITLDMVKEVVESSYLYQNIERVSSLILYELSGKGHRRRLIVTLIKYKDYYEISKAFWKRNLHFVGHSKNLYSVYFARNFYCDIDINILKKFVNYAVLEANTENYRVKSKNPICYVDYAPLSIYEDKEDLIKVLRHGEKHPVYMAFSSPQEVRCISISFKKKSDVNGTFYVITDIIFTGLECMPRPWELDPEDDLYLTSLEFWENHAYCFIPRKIRKNVTS